MARLFLPAGTNYAINPSFETDTNSDGTADGITYDAPSATLSRVAGRTGSYAQRIQYTGGAGDSDTSRYLFFESPHTAHGSFLPGEYATLSAYIKCASSGVSQRALYIAYNDSSHNYLGGAGTNFSDSSDWTRVSVTSSALPASTDNLVICVYWKSDTGDTIDLTIDDVLVEKSSVLTPYFDGSTTDSLNASTYAWTGTANASTSTRTMSRLVFPAAGTFGTTLNAATIAARIVPLYSSTSGFTPAVMPFVVGIGSEAGLSAAIAFVGTGQARMYGPTTQSTGGPTYSAGSTHHVVGRADAAGTKFRWDTTDASAGGANTMGATLDRIVLGTNHDGAASSVPQCYVGPAIVSPFYKPDAWVAAITANSGAAFNDIESLKRDFMAPGDILFTGEQARGSNIYVKGS